MAREPDDDDAKLFRNAVRDVRPLASKPRAQAPASPPRPRPRPRARRVLLEESAPASPPDERTDPMTFRRPGVPEATMRRLRRGQFAVEAEIDLHGLGALDAERALRDFLERAIGARMRCVRIVHGKGMRSGERGPVLRELSLEMLRRTSQVLAFVAASPFEGGQGAVRALLAAR